MSQYDDDYGVRSPGQKPIDPFDVVVKTSPAEPDATERARAELEVKYQQAKEFYQAYRTPEMKLYNYPIGAMLTSFLESETPRIKAEAVREFVGKLTNKIDRSFVSGVPRKAFAKGTEVYQGYNNGLSTVLYILENEFPEIAKEITEVD